MDSIYEKIIREIIKQQEMIVGSLAWTEAKKVDGLEIADGQLVRVQGNDEKVLGLLVEQYKRLFGLASVAVCKDAVKSLSNETKDVRLPDILK